MKNVHVGHVKLDPGSPIRLAVRRRFLPIIVIPGIMGTRLTDPLTKKLVWNPTGFPMSAMTGATPGPFACNYERLQQVSSELVPDDLHPGAEPGQYAHIKYYDHLVTPYYGALAEALANTTYLADDATSAPFGVRPRVYCCGYDWRQDNAKSALRLAEVVEEALRETGEEKCILVAHSMGGLVARHYCRALGGESKVFAVFSVGSPMLGAPGAYTQLKHGIPGVYAREYIHQEGDDSVATMVDNAASTATSGVAAIAAASAGVGVLGFLGPIYLVLVIAAGRLLTRRETVYFARQLQSAYQLMPGALYCDTQRHWNFFDPLNTGHPPSGYLIKFPTLLDVTVAAVGMTVNALSATARRLGDEFTQSANSYLQGGGGDRSNAALVGANSDTLAEALAGIGSLVTSGGQASIGLVVARVMALIQRATESFVDCRNNGKLYRDIFTGLLDVLELRALSAYNVEVAIRADAALIVKPVEVPHLSAVGLLTSMISGVVATFRTAIDSSGPDPITEAERTIAAEQAAEAVERARPRAYIHPLTIAYATHDVPVDGGSILLCLDIKSNYDANIVRWQLLPNLMGIAMSATTSSEAPSATFYGDGTVPLYSAKPPDNMLSHPLDGRSRTFSRIQHTDLTSEASVHKAMKSHIAELVPAWYRA